MTVEPLSAALRCCRWFDAEIATLEMTAATLLSTRVVGRSSSSSIYETRVSVSCFTEVSESAFRSLAAFFRAFLIALLKELLPMIFLSTSLLTAGSSFHPVFALLHQEL
jgi:hypothetical protein